MTARHAWVRVLRVDALLVAVWLTTVGLVLLHERGGRWGGATPLAASLRASAEVHEQWFGIYYQQERIGYASTLLIPEEREGIPGISVIDRGQLSFTLLGQPQQLAISARAFIDADWRLRWFQATLTTSTSQMSWTGRRDGEHLVITVRTGTEQTTRRLRDPSGEAFVVGLSPWTAFRRLEVGQWGNVWVVNPLALKPEEVYFHVREQGWLDGEAVLVIDTDFRGMTATSWVTADGEVLKEESPLGWELRREPREEVLAAARPTPTLDLLATTAVPIDRPLSEAQRLRRMVWLVAGLRPETVTVTRPGQAVWPADRLARYEARPPDGAWSLIELWQPARADGPSDGGAVPARYRAPSPYVQSDEERIRRQAREVVGAITDPWRRVVALHEWVFTSLTKRLTVGLPSALDVLDSKVGDCHEHTILFTALARSAGVPTRMVAGLVYYAGRLYYHAWPEVWIGGWVPTDPTLGQLVADASHLGLIEAESEDLVALGQFVGQLRVQVLQVEGDPPAVGGAP